MIYKDSNYIVVGYVKDFNVERPDFKLFTENLLRSGPRNPVWLLSHEEFYALPDHPSIRAINLPSFGQFRRDQIGTSMPSDRYAVWGFIEAIRLADEMGVPNFLYVEDDCRFAANHWDVAIMEEVADFKRHALLAGSPVFWHPWMQGHEFSRRVIDFAYEYQCRSQVPMAIEGAHISPNGPAFYPNGALGVYNTEFCKEVFKRGLEYTQSADAFSREELALEYHAFDLHIGRYFLKKFQDKSFEYLFGSAKAYSGCKDHHVLPQDRIRMLARRRKVAVHHLKYTECSELSWL